MSGYVGKHEKKFYYVWRVLGPAGPEEKLVVYGFDAAQESVKGCWDWEITPAGGETQCSQSTNTCTM